MQDAIPCRPHNKKKAAQHLLKQLKSHPVFLRSKNISFYMAEDGEVSLELLIGAALNMGKQCYLPVLHPLKEGILCFGRYHNGDVLVKNRFGLAEPSCKSKYIPVWTLDLVLMPLVGFDRHGNRLGMGGGFYDRSFAFKLNHSKKPRMPVLMGVAHQCQETEGLTRESWDVPLDYIATDREVIAV